MFRRITLLLLIAVLVLPGTVVSEEDAPTANNAFAFDLYQQVIATDEDNIVLSPYSITQAFGLAVAGASGETAQQIMAALHFPAENVHQSLADLNAALMAGIHAESDDTDLNIANALFTQQDYPFRQSYLDTVTTYYDGGLHPVDVRADPDARRLEINQWIADQTQDRIADMLPSGSVDDRTRMVLVNAIYFKAEWAHQFSTYETNHAPFYLLDGSTVEVPTMHQRLDLDYYAGTDYQALRLDYAGSDFAMLFIMPDDFANFEIELESFEEATQSLEKISAVLYVPRFRFETGLSLMSPLGALGVTDAFDWERADFSNMVGPTDELPLYIDSAVHHAFIAVDETGTEAAAVTALLPATGGGGGGPIPTEVRLDHPFLFFIYEQSTSTILFMGHVLQPVEN